MSSVYVAEAESIGFRLCRDAFWAGSKCNWVGWAASKRSGRLFPSYRSLNSSLSDGVAGVALFLVWLYSVSQEKHVLRTLRGALACLIERQQWSSEVSSHGFHEGLGGIIYTLTVAGNVLGEESLVNHAVELAHLIDTDSWDSVGVADGAAGSLLTLLELYDFGQRTSVLDAAVRLGERLVPVLIADRKPDSGHALPTWPGYPYGIGGVANAVLKLAELSGRSDYASLAVDLLKRECLEAHTSRDKNCMVGTSISDGWCGGDIAAAYSQLSAAVVLKKLNIVTVDLDRWAEIVSIAAKRCAESQVLNYSLCHGIAGYGDYFVSSNCVSLVPSQLESAHILADHALSNFGHDKATWPCGFCPGIESIGLMTGLVGIGYFFLRLASPSSIPSVLTECGRVQRIAS